MKSLFGFSGRLDRRAYALSVLAAAGLTLAWWTLTVMPTFILDRMPLELSASAGLALAVTTVAAALGPPAWAFTALTIRRGRDIGLHPATVIAGTRILPLIERFLPRFERDVEGVGFSGPLGWAALEIAIYAGLILWPGRLTVYLHHEERR